MVKVCTLSLSNTLTLYLSIYLSIELYVSVYLSIYISSHTLMCRDSDYKSQSSGKGVGLGVILPGRIKNPEDPYILP